MKSYGAIAQLGERVLCKHEVVGSIPSGSTTSLVMMPAGTKTPLYSRKFLRLFVQKEKSIRVRSAQAGGRVLSDIVKRKSIRVLFGAIGQQ